MPWRRHSFPWLFALTSCAYYNAEPASEYTTEPTTPGLDGGIQAGADIPCDIADILSTYCLGCHSDPPKNGAPIPLVQRDDLLASSARMPEQSVGERVAARVQDSTRPMPPNGLPAPSADEIAQLTNWVADGMPAESCGTPSKPPTKPEPPKLEPTICTSNDKWPIDWEDRFKDGSPDMNPGLPCRNCHLEEEDDVAFFFMGTVFPTLHEEDRCHSDVPDGTVVEIIDNTGTVALRLPVRKQGNFFSDSIQADVALPFTARVVGPDGASIQMNTPQMTGDCNGCHTEQGANGAPGRILLPTL